MQSQSPMASPRFLKAMRPAAGMLLGLIPVLAHAAGFWAEFVSYKSDVFYLLKQHLVIAGLASLFSIVVGVPLGIWLSRQHMRRYAETVMQVLNIGTTVPTLAKLAIAMLFFGLGTGSAVLGLTIAMLMPIVRTTCTALHNVAPHLLDAARGMGMQKHQILWQVELPNALNIIVAGLRTAVTYGTGTAALAFLIGGGGLGELIFTGIDSNTPAMMLAGAITTCLLAVLVDFLLYQIQYWLIPRGVNPYRDPTV
jgi:osmoprotectant transport system permease protein